MPLPPDVLRARLEQQTWTSHNILLAPELATMPGQPDFMETDLRLRAIFRVLELLYGDRLDGLRMADLGSLEGGFATALARRGANVVAIEARAANMAKAQLLKEHFDLENLELITGDVKELTRERFGSFDAILALGILYHLDRPVAWLRQLADATKRVLILDTHYAPADEQGMAILDPRLTLGGLEHVVELNGWAYVGRWFFEFDEQADREAQLWASYSNSRSFWLTKESLLLALLHAGFDLVFEQHDYSAVAYQRFAGEFPRTMLVAIKSQSGHEHA
jgi:hypothetical protein